MYRCIVRDARVYDRETQMYIEEPSMLIDGEGDTLLKWGAYINISAYYEKHNTTLSSILGTVTLCSLTALSPKEQCYVLNRAMSCTLSGFIKNLYERSESPDLKEWLASEMERVPLNQINA